MSRRWCAAALFLGCLAAVATGCGGSSSPPPDDGPGGPPPLPPVPATFADGFEGGLGNWTKDAHVPDTPGTPGVPVAWSIEEVDDPVFEGVHSARFVLDGSGDDGTIWLERPFAVTPDTDWIVRIAVTWWSESESFNTVGMVATYAGPDSPEVEQDFLITEQLNLVAGWKTYVAEFPVTSDAQGNLWVGVGLSVVWETWITYYLDDVRVWIENDEPTFEKGR